VGEPLFSEEFLRKIERLSLIARRDRGGDAVREERRGGKIEFADYRAYSRGDDLRYADWHLYGRLGHLFIKEFAREEETEAIVLLDVSGSMVGKLRGALRLAAALVTVALARGDRAGVGVMADGELKLTRPVEGLGRRAEVFERLEAAGATAGGRTDLDASLSRLPPRHGAGRRLTIVISDLFSARDGRETMARLGEDLVVFHWLSAAERSPGALGKVTLRSAEGGELAAYVGPREAAAYEREMEKHVEGLARRLRRSGGRYLVAPAEMPVTDLVLDVLTREGILR
jgi:uncharacterized protein (DUF58 family)